MKKNTKELFKIIDNIVSLLETCNEKQIKDKFLFFKGRLRILERNPSDFKSELRSIQKTLFGMGSFTDYALYPQEGFGLTISEIEKKQISLAQQLDEAIEELLKEIK